MSKKMGDIKVLINLPSPLLQAFSIDINKAKCIKCNISCAPIEDDILFHLSVCNGTLIEENIQTVFKFNCLKCNYATNNINQWRCHIFKLDHISNDSSNIRYSHNCKLCNTHYYGFRHDILQHQCKPKLISLLSEVMAFVYATYNIQSTQTMLHYCTDCFHYSHDIINLHVKKNCDAANNSVCNSCQMIFYGSSKDAYLNHKLSFEHMVLWFLNGARKTPKLSTTAFQKLPFYITKYFAISSLLEKFCCIVCNRKYILSDKCMYDHFKECISSKEISDLSSTIPLLTINCNLCNHTYFSGDQNKYKCWVNHVISYEHLSKTVVGNKNQQQCLSYYCYVSETIFYGTTCFIINLILKTNNDVGRLLFVPNVMAEIYRRITNSLLCCNVLFCCGICQNYTDDESFYCAHKKNDVSLYCSTCLTEFNVLSDYNEHLVCSEHIILKYFKPNKIGELKLNDHSMETIKMNLTNLSEGNNDGDNPTESILCQKNNEIITSKHNITSCDPEENIISNFIERLSAQPIKSAFNNYLRMNFELLNQMPLAMNVFVESISLYCDICDLVVSNTDDWIKHDNNFHLKNIDLSVFYCDVCQFYYVSINMAITHHLKTIEHTIMVEFQKYLKQKTVIKPSIINNNDSNSTDNGQKTVIKPSIINNNNSNSTDNGQNTVIKLSIINNNNSNSTDNDKDSHFSVEMKKNQDSNAKKNNKSIYIEIKDVNKNLKIKNYYSLSKIIQEKYGEFKQILNVKKTFMILFKNVDQIKCLVEDKKQLEKQHGFTIHVIGENEEKVSLETIDLFEDWRLLCTIIQSELKIMNLTLTSSKIQSNVNLLCDIIRGLGIGAVSNTVHIFGSRVYGLATKKSDVDLYLEIDGTFDGEISNDVDSQVELVKTLTKCCQSSPRVFQNVIKVCNARVPIVKFYHAPTELICDVSFKSGLSVRNTYLIKLYLSLDNTVKWLVCVIVKKWALQNGLKDKHLFTSYALIWLVLFYLMTEKVVPSVVELRQKATKNDQKIIEGWDCTFGEWSSPIMNCNRPKLLLGFFQFYANKRKLKDSVLSACTGQCMKNHKFYDTFSQLPELSKIQRTMFKNFKSKVESDFEKSYGLVLQDPFELSFNLTRNITREVLTDFCDLCSQSTTLLINTKGLCFK